MMRSLFSGVSCLRVHQTKMDVIANNISNVNTVAYKSSRVTFAEIFNQTVSSATGANQATNRGGSNPTQIGLGVNVASIDKLMSNGSAQRTDNPLDLMIQGDGFFIVGDNTGQYFTRAGNFIEDAQGNIAMNGMKLMGWDTVWDNNVKDFVIDRTAVRPVQITGVKEYLDPTSTTQVDLSGNMNPNTDPIVQRGMSFYDSVGTKYVMDVVLTHTGNTATESTWEVSFPYAEIYPNGDRARPMPITAPANFNITFDTDGHLSGVANVAGAVDATITVTPTQLDPAATLGDGTGAIIMNFGGLNQFVNETTNALADNHDGNAPGHLSGISVGGDGKIMGRYSNGLLRLLAQVPLAFFKNPAGMEKMGDNLFIPSSNSGPFDGVGRDGQVMGGVLEMSNVDLGQEFTEMITTQRGFQANSRIISSSDQMLQELVNMAR
ncbi:MAG: flagellar hook protein FlgE [Clostridiales bacterium]|nr:flagellar hook protein FlgE [Clostridiales bacterium]